MFKNLLFTLAEPGSEGGSGGGGELPVSGIPPLPSVSARERIYDHADAAPNSGSEGPEATPEPNAEPAKPSALPNSAAAADADAAPAKGKEGTPETVAEKRIRDAQAALHESTQKLAKLAREKEASDAKLAKVGKYVDLDKLEEHDKSEVEKELDQPVTKRDLEALKAPASPVPPAEPSSSSLDAPTKEKFLSDFYEKYPHVLPYAKDDMAYGIFLKEAERLGPEIAGLSEIDQLWRIGDAVATRIRSLDAEKERQIAERLNKKRSDISAGGLPPAGGAPGTGEAEDAGDDPSAEIARRHAVRNRAFTPSR